MEDDKLLQRAKQRVDAMAKGVNPFTGEVVNDSDSLSDERLQWCMGYVSKILDNVINGRYAYSNGKIPFSITEQQKSEIELSNNSIGVNELARRINEVIDKVHMCTVSGAKIASWLADNGYLDIVTNDEGKKRKILNEKGRMLGVSEVQGTNPETGDVYIKPVYNPAAQRFIIDHLEEIAAKRKNSAAASARLSGGTRTLTK